MTRPSALLITSDQQRYDTLGVTNPRIQTPALDRLCNKNTRFERAYCPSPARDHAIIENRHNPTTVHLRTYVDERYKLTVYRNADYGELFDMKDDRGELANLWNSGAHADIKSRLLHRFMRSELMREPTRMPRICGA